MERAYKNELVKLQDAELLKMMETEKDNGLKMAVYGELYLRHEKLLWLQCQRVCKRATYFDPNLPHLIFISTMELLLRKGHMIFKKRIVPPEEQSAVVLAYLSLIAKNEMLKRIEAYGEVMSHGLPDDFDIERVPAYEPPPDDLPDANDAIWKEALDSLKPMERDILITYVQHAGKDQRIPEEFRQSLKYEYNLTDENLRKKHERARTKLLNFISKKSKQNESKQRKRVAKNGKSPEKTPTKPGLSLLGNSPPGKKAKGGKPRREPTLLPGKSAGNF